MKIVLVIVCEIFPSDNTCTTERNGVSTPLLYNGILCRVRGHWILL